MKKSTIIILILFFLTCLKILVLSTSSKEQGNQVQPAPEETGRTEWRTMMRGGDISSSSSAKAYYKKRNDNLKDGGIAYWDELGPKNKSGRVRSIAFHPTDSSTFFVGAVAGGIWKTTNLGQSWTAVEDLMPNLSITSIIIHPTQPDTMYAATGEGITGDIPGDGIYRSFDGGNNWAKMPNTSSGLFSWVNKIKFDPNDPSIIWAAIGNTRAPTPGSGKLFQITNNGDGIATEEFSLWQLGGGNAVTNFWFAPNGDMYAAKLTRNYYDQFGNYFAEQGALFKKSNDSSIWSLISPANGFSANPNRVEIAFAHPHSSIIYALCQGDDVNFGQLYKTTNFGNNWTDLNLVVQPFKTDSDNNQGAYDNTIWTDPLNSSTVFIGGIDVWGSNVEGTVFSKVSTWQDFCNGTSAHADHHQLIEPSNYSASNRKIYSASDGGIAVWDFSTLSWTILNGSNMGTVQFYNSVNQGNRIIGGAQDNGVFMSVNNGTSWNKLSGGDGGYCGLGAGQNAYFSTQNGNFSKTEDNGVTSFAILGLDNEVPSGDLNPSCPPTVENDNPAFIAPLKVTAFDGEDHLVAAGESLWYSSDGGCSWSVQLPRPVESRNTYTALEMYTSNNTLHVLAGDQTGGVWRAPVTSGTWTWFEMVAQGSLQDKPVTDIAVSPHDPNDVVVTFAGTIDDNVYLTENVGNGWTEISADIPALQINTAVWNKHDDNIIYIGTDIGVLATDDRGQNWNVTPLYDGGEGPVFTEITNLEFGDQLFASTYGRGNWKSNIALQNMYVDRNMQGAYQNGTIGLPFNTANKATTEAGNGTTINFISTGDHIINEGIFINKKVTLKPNNGTVIIK